MIAPIMPAIWHINIEAINFVILLFIFFLINNSCIVNHDHQRCNKYSELIIPDITIPFVTIALAELGDKSQILIFLLASRTRKHFQFLLGVMLAFLCVDGFAILIGAWIVEVIPSFWVNVASGSIFLILGLMMLFSKKEEENVEKPQLKSPLITGFGLIFMAEWGDKTQIVSALFAAQYNPILVLISVMSALLLLSGSAIYLGKIISHKVNKNLTEKIGGLIFVILGLASMLA